jgi:hypothetical protein
MMLEDGQRVNCYPLDTKKSIQAIAGDPVDGISILGRDIQNG